MKRAAGILLSLCLLAGLSGCQLLYMEPQERLTFLGGIIEDVGRAQLTEDQDLIGKRTASSEDMYIGTYQAECSEAIFSVPFMHPGAGTGFTIWAFKLPRCT